MLKKEGSWIMSGSNYPGKAEFQKKKLASSGCYVISKDFKFCEPIFFSIHFFHSFLDKRENRKGSKVLGITYCYLNQNGVRKRRQHRISQRHA